jgi:acyl-CoA dehydrogenase
MDFSVLNLELVERPALSVRDYVLAVEKRVHQHGRAVRAEPQDALRVAEVFGLQVGPGYGGVDLNMRGQGVVFVEAGYSSLGPLAANRAVPVEGKMHLLEHLGAEEQKKRHLTPLANSATRSCFAMTEPAPGAGFRTVTLRHRWAIARRAFCRRSTAA